MPTVEREMEIMRRADLTDAQKAGKVADPGRIAALMEQAKRVEVSPLVREYILAVVNRVRAMPELRWAPGPRASVWMFRGARALAFLEGREYALPDDVKAVAENVLVHRMRLKAEYYGEREAEPRNLVWRALNEVEVPKE